MLTGRLNLFEGNPNQPDQWATLTCKVANHDQWATLTCKVANNHDQWDSQVCKDSQDLWDNLQVNHDQWDSQVCKDSQDLWDNHQVVNQAVCLLTRWEEDPEARPQVERDPRVLPLRAAPAPVTCSVTTLFKDQDAERAAHFVEHLDLPGLIE